ncbi:molecular chaperone GrpE [Novosphingobium chloroacetimidivorans]|uniref:Protein GrpE n=1 Tax=Novosphingobium chloroacetimidivorans TaxID=1428314 RepID=A0A7W7K5Q7_9SPHN|nr:nucleotide exchange factor GrpE [Novosphingobium chloroacetimidivorans]MBB4856757.1 molecular chaperone GrpE [Novosphingobium chloroacetimidivorans]
MIDQNTQPEDKAVAEELKGVPEELLEKNAETVDRGAEELARLREDLEVAKQDVLYAKAETQNVRRRLEKDIADTRAYAATGFARDILSVSDNLTRALSAIPAELREDEKMKNLVAGIEATGREIEKVFASHGISRIAAVGLPLDPNQHQAMIELPSGDAEPGTVLQELQAGYMIKDRLLRPAMVAVAKKPD